MARNRTTEHKTGAKLPGVKWLSAAARGRMLNALAKRDEAAVRSRRAVVRQLDTLRSDYRRALNALMGPGGVRRYRALRDELTDAPRAQRLRASRSLLESIAFNRDRADRLRKQYLGAASKLLRLPDVHVPPGGVIVLDDRCTPWVTYMPPYAGSFWSYSWSISDEASEPVLERHLDASTGACGSAISTRLSGADDDDSVAVVYYTALQVSHTAQATGPLEGFIAFEIRNSTYSGDVSDEWGFSDAIFSQFALARSRVFDLSGGEIETMNRRIFNFIDTDWGDGASWSNFVAMPGDIHWYHFKTEASIPQGMPLVLEAGVENQSWYHANDESIKTADDMDLRLERIVVRSCSS